jgi:type I restriction enzyme R subunit
MEWAKFAVQHKEDARAALLKRIAEAVEADGTVTVLRQGVKATGCKFRLAFFKPETSLNPDTEVLYQANQFTVMRQVRYSEDLVVFLNGLPLFTAELKNPLNDQDVRDAITQYCRTRDPREPVFALGRCLAHFAVDPFLVYVTTHLKGDETVFLPFNKGDGEGKDRGAECGFRGHQATARGRTAGPSVDSGDSGIPGTPYRTRGPSHGPDAELETWLRSRQAGQSQGRISVLGMR